VVNPYTISSATNKEIDYDKLIQKFGCYHLNQDLIDRIEKITKQPAHYYFRRGIFFSHRDLDAILTAC
jgi:tryptophanyl-tRNA synthetase